MLGLSDGDTDFEADAEGEILLDSLGLSDAETELL